MSGFGTKERAKRGRVGRWAAVAVVVAAVGTVGVTQPWRDGEVSTASDHPNATAVVQRGSLAAGLNLVGRLGYGDPTDVLAPGTGVLTDVRKPGDTVSRGDWLYEVNGVRVPLFTGARPLWRAVGPGVRGPDVEEVQQNLVDLGYAKDLGLSVNDRFTDATATAIKRWQKQLGVPQTGTLELGSVIVLPQRQVRIDAAGTTLGARLAAGSTVVLKTTGTDLVATASLKEDQLSRLAPGAAITVRFSDGSTEQGKVQGIQRGGSANAGGSGGAGGDGGAGQPKGATLVVTLQDQTAARKAGPRDVTLTVEDRKADDVLTVPVTALLALAEGGYGVQVADGGGKTRLVPVKIGLVADGKVQLTSGDVREGDQVVIPQ
ncbi:peptidoglycan-binding protein [Kitasatospora sp. NPDC059327]|uniref:peptidoglycan-binding protein n=1 Tax=Kitasatospora sp. NPDC059327 TaxID=3346803 RepID=UPI0036BD0F8A